MLHISFCSDTLVHCDAFYLLFIYISGLLCYIYLFVQMVVVVRPNAGQICACETLVEGQWAEIFILDQGALQRHSYLTRKLCKSIHTRSGCSVKETASKSVH